MKLPKSVVEQVQIGIATKNRWSDLELTLAKLAEFGLSEAKILIYDDHSDAPCTFDFTSSCRHTALTRWDVSKGQTYRRNQMAARLDSKFLLHIDDDCYPIDGSLEAAIEYAESCEDTFCLSFPIYNPTKNVYQVRSLSKNPYFVRSFIGCGSLINRHRFMEIGGYNSELVMDHEKHEKEELTSRAH